MPLQAQAWSAAKCAVGEWVVLDLDGCFADRQATAIVKGGGADDGLVSVLGVVVQARGRSRTDQCVTRLRVEASAVSASAEAQGFSAAWAAVPGGHPDGGGEFETGLAGGGDGSPRSTLLFPGGAVRCARVRISPCAWQKHLSLRCGVLAMPPPQALLHSPPFCFPRALPLPSFIPAGSVPATATADGRSSVLVAASPARALVLLPEPLAFSDPGLSSRLLRAAADASLHSVWFAHPWSSGGPSGGGSGPSLEVFSAASLGARLHLVLPPAWRGATAVAWAPTAPACSASGALGVATLACKHWPLARGGGGGGGGREQPDSLWLRRFWRFLDDEHALRAAIASKGGVIAGGGSSGACAAARLGVAASVALGRCFSPSASDRPGDGDVAALLGDWPLLPVHGVAHGDASAGGRAAGRLVRLDLAPCVLRVPRAAAAAASGAAAEAEVGAAEAVAGGAVAVAAAAVGSDVMGLLAGGLRSLGLKQPQARAQAPPQKQPPVAAVGGDFDADLAAAIAASLGQNSSGDVDFVVEPLSPIGSPLVSPRAGRTSSAATGAPFFGGDTTVGGNAAAVPVFGGGGIAPPAVARFESPHWQRELAAPALVGLRPREAKALALLHSAGVPVLLEEDPTGSGLGLGLPAAPLHLFTAAPAAPTGDGGGGAGAAAASVASGGGSGMLACELLSAAGALRAVAALGARGLRRDQGSAAGLTAGAGSSGVAFDPSVWVRGDRELLLAWFGASVGQLAGAELEALRSLPLFEREDGGFVSLTGLAQPRTVPPDLPGIELLDAGSGSGGGKGGGDSEDLVVFRRKPVFEAVYEALGLEELTEAELYLGHIFPRYSSEQTTRAESVAGNSARCGRLAIHRPSSHLAVI